MKGKISIHAICAILLLLLAVLAVLFLFPGIANVFFAGVGSFIRTILCIIPGLSHLLGC